MEPSNTVFREQACWDKQNRRNRKSWEKSSRKYRNNKHTASKVTTGCRPPPPLLYAREGRQKCERGKLPLSSSLGQASNTAKPYHIQDISALACDLPLNESGELNRGALQLTQYSEKGTDTRGTNFQGVDGIQPSGTSIQRLSVQIPSKDIQSKDKDLQKPSVPVYLHLETSEHKFAE